MNKIHVYYAHIALSILNLIVKLYLLLVKHFKYYQIKVNMKILLQSEAKTISTSKILNNQQELINFFERIHRFLTSTNCHWRYILRRKDRDSKI